MVRKTHLIQFLSRLKSENLLSSSDLISWICREVKAEKDDNLKTQVAQYLKEQLSREMSPHSYYHSKRNDDIVAIILTCCFELGLQNVFKEWLATVTTRIPLRAGQLLAKLIASDSSQLGDWESW